MNEANHEPIIIVRGVEKWYGHFQALKGVDMEVKKGEVIVIFGPSGSGKSTFIRCINHLEDHQGGQIIVDGIKLTNDMKNIEAVRMETGMVFQRFNLFPHLTVMQNVTLAPIQVRKWPKDQADRMYFFNEGLIVETGTPEEIFSKPKEARTKLFLSQILEK